MYFILTKVSFDFIPAEYGAGMWKKRNVGKIDKSC